MKNPAPESPWTPADIAVIAAHLNVADNHLELQVRIALIQTQLRNSPSLDVVAKYTARHSILKIRLGAVPDTEVKIPQVPPGKAEQPGSTSVFRSSHIWEDAEVIRPDVRRRGQTGCDVTARFVDRNKIQPSIGADIHSRYRSDRITGTRKAVRRRFRRHRCDYRCRSSPARSDRSHLRKVIMSAGGQPSTV